MALTEKLQMAQHRLDLHEKTIQDQRQELELVRQQMKAAKEKSSEPSSLVMHLQKELIDFKVSSGQSGSSIHLDGYSMIHMVIHYSMFIFYSNDYSVFHNFEFIMVIWCSLFLIQMVIWCSLFLIQMVIWCSLFLIQMIFRWFIVSNSNRYYFYISVGMNNECCSFWMSYCWCFAY